MYNIINVYKTKTLAERQISLHQRCIHQLVSQAKNTAIALLLQRFNNYIFLISHIKLMFIA